MLCAKKVWGWTTELFRNNTASTHYLEIKKNGYCSEHRHAQKSNEFFVIEGRLELTIWTAHLPNASIVVLTPGANHFSINPGFWHKFRALTDVKCVEIYDYKYDGVDIERRTEGGLKDA